MISGSAFMRANGSRSPSVQRRSNNRFVRSTGGFIGLADKTVRNACSIPEILGEPLRPAGRCSRSLTWVMLRQSLQSLQDHPGYRPGEHNLAITSIHEARFVL